MSKTPEEMAEEYCNTKQLSYVEQLVITKGFLAGYKAAQDQVADEIAAIRESWSASKVNELIYENAQLTAELSTIKNK